MMHFYGIEYDEQWDSCYFVSDGEWAEDECDDENCFLCTNRPETAYTNLITMPV